MQLRYTRQGGIAGLSQTLIVREGTLQAEDRGRKVAERALTSAERSMLEDLLARAEQAKALGSPEESRVRDGFVLTLAVGDEGEPRYRTSTFGVPFEAEAGDAWGQLAAWLDGELTKLTTAQGSRLLSVEELIRGS